MRSEGGSGEELHVHIHSSTCDSSELNDSNRAGTSTGI